MSTITHHRALNAGEWRMKLNGREAAMALHLVSVAAENPERFGGLDERGRGWAARRDFDRLCVSLMRRLQHWRAGDPIVISREQRELLHTVLDAAGATPVLFGNYRTSGETALWYRQLIHSLRRRLPPRGVGTYGD